MGYNRGEMKREVKGIMRQTRPSPLLLTALFLIIVWAGSFLIQKLCSFIGGGDLSGTMMKLIQVANGKGDIDDLLEIMGRDLVGMLTGMIAASLLSSILAYLWSSMMNVGYEGYSLSLERGENPGVERLFCAFPQFGGVLATRILVGLFSFLWMLLFTVGLVVIIAVLARILGDSGIIVLLMLLLMIAYIVALVWVVLRYAFADYALLDYKLGGLDAIRRSKQMTKGNKGKIFVLGLSFFGWELLKGLIMLAGIVVSGFLLMGKLERLIALLERDPMSFLPALLSVGVGPLVGIGLSLLGCFVLELWLVPYRTACTARLYDKVRVSGNYGDIVAASVAAAHVGPSGPVAGPGATVYPPSSVPPAYPSNPSGYGGGQSGYGVPSQPGYGAPPSAYGGQAYGASQAVTPPVSPVAPPVSPVAPPVSPVVPPVSPVVPPAGQGAYAPPPYSAPTMPLTPSSAAPSEMEAPTIILAPKKKAPAAPEAPAAPAAPVVREVPPAPAAPVVHEVPPVPAAPVVHEAPAAPGAAPEEPPIPPAAWSANPGDRT